MIPVFKPKIDFSDIRSVLKALIGNNISGTSPVVKEFENNFSKKFSRDYGVSVSNGSVALDVALKVLNLKENDEVIVPSFTIISCLSAIIRSGAKPIFCDVDPQSWNMTLQNVKDSFSTKTKAVLVVHTYGLVADIKRISDFCKDNSLFLIEDAAEAHGQKIDKQFCGSFGDVSTFSFYANKHITTGEGGILLTDSKNFYEEAKKIRNLDFDNKKRFQHENLYWNYRLSGLQAALGNSQIKKLDKTINFKIKQGNYYRYLLSDALDFIELPLEEHNGTLNHYWVFGILLKKENVRDKLIEELLKEGIETRPFFWPLHLQPVIKDISKENKNLIISEKLGRNGLYIPTGRHITPKLQKKIVKILLEKLREI